MREDGLRTIRIVVRHVLKAQLQGNPLSIADLIRETGKGKNKISEGSVYNAIRFMRERGILITKPMKGRKNSIAIQFGTVFKSPANKEMGARFVEIRYLPQDVKSLMTYVYWNMYVRSAVMETVALKNIQMKYMGLPPDKSAQVLDWLYAKIFDAVIQYLSAPDDTTKFFDLMEQEAFRMGALQFMRSEGAKREEQGRPLVQSTHEQPMQMDPWVVSVLESMGNEIRELERE